MASNSSKKNKSSGLRILWIPGRKNHSKGRLSSTNKSFTYSPNQKKSEVWSLGGSRAQRELIDLPTPEASGSSTSSSALDSMSSTLAKSAKLDIGSQEHDTKLGAPHDKLTITESVTMPSTPTTPHLSSPVSEQAPSTPSTIAMTSPVVVTKVDILDLHTILNEVPSIGDTTDLSTSAIVLNSSAGTTASIATDASPLAHRKANGKAGQKNSGKPQKTRYQSKNNNQEDINSIESLDSFKNHAIKAETKHKNKRKKSKKLLADHRELDQLDGTCKLKDDMAKSQPSKEDKDEKVVKCLYYSLMCCDCTIS